ncbi:MAG TPA: OmcA/MtrC family decaheme c-type cytochrome [Anaeromyxobacteraceae bacterium]|nr:OmcA/MtrC family decaheme c-type cytochrome [Anaeromyxobacteraceae bacterium]
MNLLKSRALTLLAATALAATACQGAKGIDGANGAAGTTGASGANGTNGTDGGSGANGASGTNGTSGVNGGQTTGLVLALTGAPTINADQSVTIRFTAKDDQGFPVDLLKGKYSLNTVNVPRFAIAQVNQAAGGSVLPYNVLTASGSLSQDPALPAPDPATVKTSPSAFTPSLTTPNALTTGILVENPTGAGDYTYTFPTGTMTSAAGTGSNLGKTTYSVTRAVKVDPASTASYAIWIQATRQTNVSSVNDPKGFKAVNYQYSFIPGSNSAPTKRELVLTASCNKCHNGFKPESTLASGGFHGYGRVEGPFCNVCHNVARNSTATNSDGVTPAADSAIFVHRLHRGKSTQIANQFHAMGEATYPQDLRNCDTCHAGAAQGGQAKTRADRAVCGSCHDYVDFTGTKGYAACTNPVTVDAAGLPVPCVHLPGANTDDTSCAGCHIAGVNPTYFIGDKHVAVAPPDPANIFIPVTSGVVTAGYQGGTLTDCTVAGACSAVVCTAAAPCYDPVKLSQVTKNTTSGSLLVGGKACGSGHQPSLFTPCTCNTGAALTCLGSGNNNTNAANLAAAGAVPTGASVVNYSLSSVSVAGASKNPVIKFKFQLDGQDVTFNRWGSGKTELMDGFVGSPSVYWVFALKQDNITAPADFNASFSAYVKSIWSAATTTGSATVGTNSAGVACTVAAPCDCTLSACYAAGADMMTGPDASKLYTITLGTKSVPASAVMLTGGVGYTYGLTSTQPLTQIAVPGFQSYDSVTKQGGVTVAAPNQTKVATGYTGRRAIVETVRCNNCHAQLGAEPTFHAGQRNDGPTCSWCHTPNRTSSGWSANAKDFIHAVHAGSKRTVAFNWHAGAPGETYAEVTFPGQTNYCQACHLPGTYDFSATASAAAVPNLLASTVAAGKFNGEDTTANFTFSPFISTKTDASFADATLDYGYVYATTQPKDAYGVLVASKAACSLTAPCDADPTTLVVSPITAACVACHDDAATKAHMVGNGASFYLPRSAAAGNVEQCLLCHGPQPGAIAPIAAAHQ